MVAHSVQHVDVHDSGEEGVPLDVGVGCRGSPNYHAGVVLVVELALHPRYYRCSGLSYQRS